MNALELTQSLVRLGVRVTDPVFIESTGGEHSAEEVRAVHYVNGKAILTIGDIPIALRT